MNLNSLTEEQFRVAMNIRPKRRSGIVPKYLTFFLLVGPALLLRLATAVYPVFKTLYLSFFDLNLISQVHQFVGWGNFIKIIHDPEIREILAFTIMFILASTICQLLLGLGVASLLNARFKGRQFVRTINLIPWAIPTVVASIAFRWMLDDQYGLITDLIFKISGLKPVLLIYPLTAQICVILVNVWKNTPFMAIVMLAGLQGVPEELYEAAKIDGAGKFKSFLHITIPISIPLIITLGLFNIIWQLANFDIIYGLTYGSPGVATTLLSYRIFQKGMLFYDWGMASALSAILIGIVGVIGLIGLHLFKRYDVSL